MEAGCGSWPDVAIAGDPIAAIGKIRRERGARRSTPTVTSSRRGLLPRAAPGCGGLGIAMGRARAGTGGHLGGGWATADFRSAVAKRTRCAAQFERAEDGRYLAEADGRREANGRGRTLRSNLDAAIAAEKESTTPRTWGIRRLRTYVRANALSTKRVPDRIFRYRHASRKRRAPRNADSTDRSRFGFTTSRTRSSPSRWPRPVASVSPLGRMRANWYRSDGREGKRDFELAGAAPALRGRVLLPPRAAQVASRWKVGAK